MQKDMHYCMTAAIAKFIGLPDELALRMAWANQFTDDCTDEGKYSIRTQCDAVSGQWWSREVQQFVIIPFHFLPGNDANNKWLVIANCNLGVQLLRSAVDYKDVVAFGMALHSLQDTYSHQGFTGWQDDLNAKHSWDLTTLLIPRVGHAEYRLDPDDLDAIWSRGGIKIDNKDRAKHATRDTFVWVNEFFNNYCSMEGLDEFITELVPFWNINSYDERKRWLMEFAGLHTDYSDYQPTQEELDKFASAARRQVAQVLQYVA